MKNLMTLAAVFLSNPDREYHYLVPTGDRPEVGDLIVTSISTPDNTLIEQRRSKSLSNAAFKVEALARIARVTEIHNVASPKANRMYLQLVSQETVRSREQENQEIKERIARRERAMVQLQDLLEQQSLKDRFAALAASDPRAAALLAELDE